MRIPRWFSILAFCIPTVPAMPLRADILITATGARRSGDWTAISAPNSYGGVAWRAPAGAGGSKAAYRPVLDQDGIYAISLWWPDGDSSWGANVPVFVEAADHLRNIRVDMRSGGGRWNFIGEYRLPAGRDSGVVITDMGEGYSVADTVVFEWVRDAPEPGRTYYVAPGGDDGGPGTLSEPWATIQKAAAAMYPGDTVCVRGGTYTGSVAPSRSGTTHSYISYRAYPGETPVLHGGGTTGFDLTGRSWIRLEGLTVSGFSGNGVLAGAGAHDIEMLDCVLEGNCTGSVWTGGFMALQDTSEIYLEGCVARDNAGFGFASDFTPRARYVTLSSCESARNGNDGFGFYADRVYVRDCVSHENGWNIAGNGDDFDFIHSTDAIFERCMAWGSDAAPYKVGGGYNVFSNCISANTAVAAYGRYFGITFYEAARGIVYNCSVRGVCLKGNGPYTVKNSIIRKNGSASTISVALYCGSAAAALDSDHNLFLPDVRYGADFDPLMHVGPDVGGTDYASLAAWQATGRDAHSISAVASPFVDEGVPGLDFRLRAGCAAIDAGTGNGAPAGDWFGCGRWDDPSTAGTGVGARAFVDIGACEYLTDDADSDGDGVADYDEIAYDGVALLYTPGYDLDPLNPDTDGDGVADGIEDVCPGGDPLLYTANPSSASVSFQPPGVRPAVGHVSDAGLSFTQARGYGWL